MRVKVRVGVRVRVRVRVRVGARVRARARVKVKVRPVLRFSWFCLELKTDLIWLLKPLIASVTWYY